MSFESKSVSSSPGEIQKFPFRRLEPSINKFIKVIEIDLDRLHQHKLNREKVNNFNSFTPKDDLIKSSKYNGWKRPLSVQRVNIVS